jgi:ABC-2 type transport system permease protein
MTEPGSLLWFARHELRLAWRDTLSMMTAGRRDRERKAAIGAVIFVGFMHFVAFLVLGRYGRVSADPGLSVLIVITSGVLLSGSAMLSQAMESVTRAFYTRSDLELILASPARAERLFAVRIGAMALSVSLMSVFLIGPFVNVLAWRGGLRWLAAYGVIVAVALTATSLAVLLTVALFRTIGPKRTRLAAQIVAAVIGGVFVIGLQMAAMFSTGTLSRFAFLRSQFVMSHAPDIHSVFWWPARAALGDAWCLCAILAVSVALFLAVTARMAPRFGDCAIAAAGASQASARAGRIGQAFRVYGAARTLRRKEWLLLMRDPWLMSQSLMQLLYLLPPTALLWRSFSFGGDVSIILAPVVIMAAGQLAGGLAWLTISGEDAPDLVASAPVTPARILRAKIEAVMGVIAIVFAPFVLGLALISPARALVTACGIAASAASATAIQLWFRSQAKRSQFRRRHTSSRIATFAEAFSSICWAGTGAIAVAGSWLAVIMAAIALAILGGVRWLSPARAVDRVQMA